MLSYQLFNGNPSCIEMKKSTFLSLIPKCNQHSLVQYYNSFSLVQNYNSLTLAQNYNSLSLAQNYKLSLSLSHISVIYSLSFSNSILRKNEHRKVFWTVFVGHDLHCPIHNTSALCVLALRGLRTLCVRTWAFSLQLEKSETLLIFDICGITFYYNTYTSYVVDNMIFRISVPEYPCITVETTFLW